MDTPGTFKTTTEIFDNGLKLRPNAPFLGRRPLVSATPLKFADHYVWETYSQIDKRRRNLGSAIYSLFEQGVLGGGELPTVGIWSPNRPGMYIIPILKFQHKCRHSFRMASDRPRASVVSKSGRQSIRYAWQGRSRLVFIPKAIPYSRAESRTARIYVTNHFALISDHSNLTGFAASIMHTSPLFLRHPITSPSCSSLRKGYPLSR
jgi:hypothetical protein